MSEFNTEISENYHIPLHKSHDQFGRIPGRIRAYKKMFLCLVNSVRPVFAVGPAKLSIKKLCISMDLRANSDNFSVHKKTNLFSLLIFSQHNKYNK
jgi:hypothetical protein